MVMGRVTYLHHYVRIASTYLAQMLIRPLEQLPALYFAVLMFGGLLDHYVFGSKRFNSRTKWTVFAIVAYAIVDAFWRFSPLAFGMDGPAADYKGLGWRKVRRRL